MDQEQPLQQNIIQMLGLEQLAPEKQATLVAKMTELVQKRLLLRILQMLPEETKKQFLQASAARDTQTVDTIIQQHVPNITDITFEEIEKLKQEMQTEVAQDVPESSVQAPDQPAS